MWLSLAIFSEQVVTELHYELLFHKNQLNIYLFFQDVASPHILKVIHISELFF